MLLLSLYGLKLTHVSKRGPTLHWRHNGRDSVPNHQPHDCLLNRLFRRRSKKTPKLRATGLCAGNSPGTGEFPAQIASYAENVSIWWSHHADGTKRVPANRMSSLTQTWYNRNGANLLTNICILRHQSHNPPRANDAYMRQAIRPSLWLAESYHLHICVLSFYVCACYKDESFVVRIWNWIFSRNSRSGENGRWC